MPTRPQSPYQHRYGQIPMLYDDPFGRPRFPSTVRHAGERVLYVSSCVDLRRKCTEPLAKIHICRFDATLCTVLDTTRFAKPAPPLTTSSMYGWLHATCHYWENVTYFQKKKLFRVYGVRFIITNILTSFVFCSDHELLLGHRPRGTPPPWHIDHRSRKSWRRS